MYLHECIDENVVSINLNVLFTLSLATPETTKSSKVMINHTPTQYHTVMCVLHLIVGLIYTYGNELTQ